MKKILSIILTVTMIFSLVAAFRVPTASAAVDSLARATSTYKFVDPYPGPTGSLVQGDTTARSVTSSVDKVPVFTMGEYIDGTTATTTGTVELRKVDGLTVVQTSNIAGNKFRLPTDNVDKDGLYDVYDATAGHSIGWVLIKYNFSIDQSTLDFCKTGYISGYVKHGDGTGASGAAVAVLYPDGDYLIYATVDTHGQFAMTVSATERGIYSVVVIDDYPTLVVHNAAQDSTASTANTVDAVLYKQLTTTTLVWSLDTFVDPTIIYENAAGEQSFVLKLFADDGSPVDPDPTMTWTVTGFTLSEPIKEISPGFYRFIGTTNLGATYVKVSVKSVIGQVTVTASKTLPVTKLTEWNPQVVVDTYYVSSYWVATDVYYTGHFELTEEGPGSFCAYGRQYYDKLPCTVGNSLVIYPIVYGPKDSTHYQIHSWDAVVDGPVTFYDNVDYFEDVGVNDFDINNEGAGLDDDEGRYLVNAAGTITVHFDAEIWQMADYSCNTFEGGRNACCIEKSADFTVCKNETCTVDSVTTVKNSDGTYDIKIAISADPTKNVDCELCDKMVAHIYTIDDITDCGPNGDLNLWYNPIPIDKNPFWTAIPDIPVQFDVTNVDFVRDGNTLIIKGVDLDGLCEDTFVVQVFGTKEIKACAGPSLWTHPLYYEDLMSVDLYDTTTINATYSIEGRTNATELTAGVCDTVVVTGAKFTLDDPTWTFKFAGSKMTSNLPSVVDMGNGVYNFVISPAFAKAGDFVITGTAIDGCDKEVVTITISVKMPEFTVKIGLKDGSIIDNDHIVTEGFYEDLYVTAVDPRDQAEITLENLSVSATLCSCDLPSSVVYGTHPQGCTGINPLRVIGLDNPNIDCDPQFKLYATLCGTNVLVDTFTLVKPTISADPTKDIPFYGCPTCGEGTIVTFSVIDAHTHGVPNAAIWVADWSSVKFDTAYTGPDGKVKWNFQPTYQGNFYVYLGALEGMAVGDVTVCPSQFGFSNDTCCVFKDWIAPLTKSTTQTLTTVYKAPEKDTTVPVITIDAPADGTEVNTPVIKVSGKATDNVKVVSLLVNGESVTVLPDDTFSTKVALEEGKNIIKIFASDAANNSVEKDLTVTYTVSKVTVVKIQIGSDIMIVNGKAVQIDAPAEIMNGRTFLPLRAISEALGATVDWIAETQGITVTLGKNTIGLQVGNTSAVVNGTVMTLDAAPYIKNSRTMVPFRVIAEGLGATVEWDPALRIVTVTLAQ